MKRACLPSYTPNGTKSHSPRLQAALPCKQHEQKLLRTKAKDCPRPPAAGRSIMYQDSPMHSLAMPRPNGHQVKGVPHAFKVVLLQLQPVRAALAGLVGAVQGLHDQALCAMLDSILQKCRQLLRVA